MKAHHVMYRGGSVTVIVVPWTINIKKDKNKLGYNTSALGNQYVEVGWTARTRRTCPFCHVLFIRFFVVVLSACFLSQDTSLVQKKSKKDSDTPPIQYNEISQVLYFILFTLFTLTSTTCFLVIRPYCFIGPYASVIALGFALATIVPKIWRGFVECSYQLLS